MASGNTSRTERQTINGLEARSAGRRTDLYISHGVNEFTRRCQEALLLKDLWAVGRLSAEDNGITRPNKTDCP
jgi:hypothetical protein